jgi:hypothetical protein
LHENPRSGERWISLRHRTSRMWRKQVLKSSASDERPLTSHRHMHRSCGSTGVSHGVSVSMIKLSSVYYFNQAHCKAINFSNAPSKAVALKFAYLCLISILYELTTAIRCPTMFQIEMITGEMNHAVPRGRRGGSGRSALRKIRTDRPIVQAVMQRHSTAFFSRPRARKPGAGDLPPRQPGSSRAGRAARPPAPPQKSAGLLR